MLAARGHTAEHVTDVTRGDAPDRELWDYAVEHGAVLITKDEDFSDMVLLGKDAPVVVWVRVGNTRRSALLDRIMAMVEAGHRLIEMR